MTKRGVMIWILIGAIAIMVQEYRETHNKILWWLCMITLVASLLIGGALRMYYLRRFGRRQRILKHMLVIVGISTIVASGAYYAFVMPSRTDWFPSLLWLSGIAWAYLGAMFSLAGYSFSDIFFLEDDATSYQDKNVET
jgi:branched-subunit amino acid ABC-type transport system permease component